MSINLETPKKIRPLIDQAHQVAMNMLRPISRKYDLAEHEYPKELDMLAAMIDGLAESGASGGAGAAGVPATGGQATGVGQLAALLLRRGSRNARHPRRASSRQGRAAARRESCPAGPAAALRYCCPQVRGVSRATLRAHPIPGR